MCVPSGQSEFNDSSRLSLSLVCVLYRIRDNLKSETMRQRKTVGSNDRLSTRVASLYIIYTRSTFICASFVRASVVPYTHALAVSGQDSTCACIRHLSTRFFSKALASVTSVYTYTATSLHSAIKETMQRSDDVFHIYIYIYALFNDTRFRS